MKRRTVFTVDLAAIRAFLAVDLADMYFALGAGLAQVVAIENDADALFNQGYQL